MKDAHRGAPYNMFLINISWKFLKNMNLLIYLDYSCIKSKLKWESVEHSVTLLKLSKEFWECGYYCSNYAQHYLHIVNMRL